ncbi:MAG: ATP-binding cassette domain-containing protein [Clostridiales bacterium]|nr:ATP-binding cassette domain-containing protein [Clostridiales bacterium]
MLASQVLLTIALIAGVLIGYFVLKFKKKSLSKYVYIVLASVLAVSFFFRFMLGDEAIRDVFRLTGSPLDTKFETVVSLLGYWLMLASMLLIVLYPLFKKSAQVVLIKYFALPVSILCLLAIYPITKGIVGVTCYTEFDIRILLISIELSTMISMSTIIFVENGCFKTNRKDLLALLFIPLCIAVTIPIFMLSALFGEKFVAREILDLSVNHRKILYLAFIIPFVTYLLFRKKDYETKRLALLYFSLATLITFCINFKFADLMDVTAWPIHLCHTAMFIIPLCLIFKWDKIFYFTYFINVLGAFLAMAMPNYTFSNDLFRESLVNFYINHFIAFFMPILIVMLGVYQRPRFKQFKYSMIGFGIYFVFVLIMNAWFSNYGEVDYFYLNTDFIADKLGVWAENTRNITWSFNIGELNFLFYPLYQFLYFIIYVAMGAGVWFLYEAMYIFEDTVLDILERKKKIKADALALSVALAGRSKGDPMNKKGVNKLIINNFSKRYGASGVYAVKDASLEINGGEIFGFLGHNGAGKSTIIKSIVGIQPITSGSIEVCGYDVDKQSVEAKTHIGFVPDHYALYEKLTGREYINYIADLYSVSKEDRDARIDKYVKLFELGDAFDNQIKTYSHGMKQKVTIISALVHNPKVWILDEPLTGLDPTSIYQVKECMREHARQGNIVFFSSHLIDIVESLCDRIAIIKKGHILTCKTLKEIEAETTLEQFYLDITSTRVQASSVKAQDIEKEKESIKAIRAQEKIEREEKKKAKKELKAKLKAERVAANQIVKNKKINKEDKDAK